MISKESNFKSIDDLPVPSEKEEWPSVIFFKPIEFKKRVDVSPILFKFFGNLVEEVNMFYDIEHIETKTNKNSKKKEYWDWLNTLSSHLELEWP